MQTPYNNIFYYTTETVKGPIITKIYQSECFVAGPTFSKHWDLTLSQMILCNPTTGRSRVINLSLTRLAQDPNGRMAYHIERNLSNFPSNSIQLKVHDYLPAKT